MDFTELVAKEFMDLHREILAEQRKTNAILEKIASQAEDTKLLAISIATNLVVIQGTMQTRDAVAQKLASEVASAGLDDILSHIKS